LDAENSGIAVNNLNVWTIYDALQLFTPWFHSIR